MLSTAVKMDIFFSKIMEMSFWSKLANLHGSLAMLSLILFGASFALFSLAKNTINAISGLKTILLLLFITLSLLDIFGLLVYIPYRAEGGPRDILKSSEQISWLHTIVFEHKEFVAYAPPILILAAFFIVSQLGKDLFDKKNIYLKRSVLILILFSLIFVLTVAGEAVLVTKVVPI